MTSNARMSTENLRPLDKHLTDVCNFSLGTEILQSLKVVTRTWTVFINFMTLSFTISEVKVGGMRKRSKHFVENQRMRDGMLINGGWWIFS